MTLFEKIINREIFADIIYEDKKVIAFNDIKPKRKGHFLVVPKIHSINLYDIKDDDFQYLIFKTKELALKITKELNVDGFNIVINNGKNAGQEIFHTHIHVIPSDKKK